MIDRAKPILRFTRRGWRWAWDLRFIDNNDALAGCIAYVGPYPSAREAFEEARWIGAR